MMAVSLPLKIPASTALPDGLLEQLGVGVVDHHAGAHEAEGGGGDAAELVVDAHGRLPVGVDPGAPGGLGARSSDAGAGHREATELPGRGRGDRVVLLVLVLAMLR